MTAAFIGADSRPQEVFAIESALYSALETQATLFIKIMRGNPLPNQEARVGIFSEGGNAVPGLHYTAVSRLDESPIIFSAGVTSVTLQVPILNAGLGQGNVKTFSLQLVKLTSHPLIILSTPDRADVLIAGSGVAAPTGSVGFEAAAYTLDESAAYGTTVRLVRQGGSAGVINWTVTSTNGSATSGTHYTAVNQSGSFADGDTTPKNISVTVSAVDADRTFSLGVTGGVVGPITQASVQIKDLAAPPPPPVPNFPLLAYIHTGSLTAMSTAQWQTDNQYWDMVVLRFDSESTSSDIDSVAGALKVLNPNMKVLASVQPITIHATASAEATRRDYMRAKNGLSGVTGSSWIQQSSPGVEVVSGAALYTLIEDTCLDDTNGDNAAEYSIKSLADWIFNASTGIGKTNVDGILVWDCGNAPLNQTATIWDSTAVATPRTNASRAASWRAGLKKMRDKFRALYPAKIFAWRASSWITDQSFGDLSSSAQWQGSDGFTLESFSGIAGNLSGIVFEGCDCLERTGTGVTHDQRLSLAMDALQGPYTAAVNFASDPSRNILQMRASAISCFSAAGQAANWEIAAYEMCWALVCSDYHVMLTADGVQWVLDEMCGGTSRLLADFKWLGEPLQPPRPLPTGTNFAVREFQNGCVLLRKIGSGSADINITLPAAGAGKKWVRIGTGASPTQRPTINTGADQVGDVATNCRIGIAFKRVAA